MLIHVNIIKISEVMKKNKKIKNEFCLDCALIQIQTLQSQPSDWQIIYNPNSTLWKSEIYNWKLYNKIYTCFLVQFK